MFIIDILLMLKSDFDDLSSSFLPHPPPPPVRRPRLSLGRAPARSTAAIIPRAGARPSDGQPGGRQYCCNSTVATVLLQQYCIIYHKKCIDHKHTFFHANDIIFSKDRSESRDLSF